jgi:hypothetical protein
VLSLIKPSQWTDPAEFSSVVAGFAQSSALAIAGEISPVSMSTPTKIANTFADNLIESPPPEMSLLPNACNMHTKAST